MVHVGEASGSGAAMLCAGARRSAGGARPDVCCRPVVIRSPPPLPDGQRAGRRNGDGWFCLSGFHLFPLMWDPRISPEIGCAGSIILSRLRRLARYWHSHGRSQVVRPRNGAVLANACPSRSRHLAVAAPSGLCHLLWRLVRISHNGSPFSVLSAGMVAARCIQVLGDRDLR